MELWQVQMSNLSTSSRKCTVTGIDNHEIPGLDLVQCAALVQTNHGMFNIIMNEYAYYGRSHSIHPSEAEDDTSEENSVNKIQPHTENGEQNVQEVKLLSTNFEG